jgi:hypothetical protein
MTALGNVVLLEKRQMELLGSLLKKKNQKMVFGNLKIFSKSLDVDNYEIY